MLFNVIDFGFYIVICLYKKYIIENTGINFCRIIIKNYNV